MATPPTPPIPTKFQRVSEMFTGEWLDVGRLDEIPMRGARTIPVAGGEEIAVFRTGDNHVFALVNRCPHKQGPLSQGIVHGHSVACTLPTWPISISTGVAQAPDKGRTQTAPGRGSARRGLLY